jgi:hypothetical protein
VCCICLSPWDHTGEHGVVECKCRHKFGKSCITEWVRRYQTCPRCREGLNLNDIIEGSDAHPMTIANASSYHVLIKIPLQPGAPVYQTALFGGISGFLIGKLIHRFVKFVCIGLIPSFFIGLSLYNKGYIRFTKKAKEDSLKLKELSGNMFRKLLGSQSVSEFSQFAKKQWLICSSFLVGSFTSLFV